MAVEIEEEVEGLATLTLKALAQATKIQEWRIRELVRNGKGPPHFRVGTTYRFPIDGVREWYKQQCNQTQQER